MKKTIRPLIKLNQVSFIDSHSHSLVFDSNQTGYFLVGQYDNGLLSKSLVYSFNKNGELKTFATLPFKHNTGTSALHILHNNLIVGLTTDDANFLLAYSTHGEFLWSINCPSPIQDITSIDDSLIITCYNQIDNAELLWTSLKGCVYKQLPIKHLWLPPIVNGNRIFVGQNNGITVYDSFGNLINQIVVKRGLHPFKNPIVNSNVALTHIPVLNNTLIYSIDESGNVKNQTEFHYNPIGFVWNNHSNGKIFAISRMNRLYTIDISKKEIINVTILKGHTIFPPLSIKNHKIVIGYKIARNNSIISIMDDALKTELNYRISGELVDITLDSSQHLYAVTCVPKTREINIFHISVH